MKTILSKDNARVKQARALRQRKQRQETGLFVVEGIRHVGEAVQAGAAIEYILYSPEILSSDFAHGLVEDQSRSGLPCYAVDRQVFTSLAEKENPQGLLAVVHQRWHSFSELNPQNFPWGVGLVSPQDPGNIGAILRTIDAVGASGLILLDQAADPYHPSSVRASMGSIFYLPLVAASFDEFIGWAKSQDYTIYGTSAHGSTDYLSVPGYQAPLVLLMGSEREGLLPDQKVVCDQLLRMPMKGRVTSLNLAVATGVMLYSVLEKLEIKQS